MLGQIDSTDITEASGLAVSWRNQGVIWTHNDGSSEKIYAISTAGKLIGTFKLNKSVQDIEDIAVGPGPDPAKSYLYVGDIGSNTANRDEVRIVRTPEPAVSPTQGLGTSDFKDVDTFRLKYPNGSFDAEAILVDPINHELFVVTKEPTGAHVFRIGIDTLVASEPSTLEQVAELTFERVSGGAISRDGQFIALRREENAYIWRREPGQSVTDALKGPGEPLPVVGPPDEQNGEALSFLQDSSGYMTLSEGLQQNLYLFRRNNSVTETPQFVGEPTLSGTSCQLQIVGCAGTQIALQRSADLKSWATVQTITASGEVQTLLDTDRSPGRFYRLVTQ